MALIHLDGFIDVGLLGQPGLPLLHQQPFVRQQGREGIRSAC